MCGLKRTTLIPRVPADGGFFPEYTEYRIFMLWFEKKDCAVRENFCAVAEIERHCIHDHLTSTNPR